MTRKERNDDRLHIDPSMIILVIGYATSLCVAAGWVATLIL